MYILYIHMIYVYIYIYILSATALLAVRRVSCYSEPAWSAVQYSYGPGTPYETLVDRFLGSLGLGDLFWVGPGPEAGHGGSCIRDPTPPLSLIVAVARCYPLVVGSPRKL